MQNRHRRKVTLVRGHSHEQLVKKKADFAKEINSGDVGSKQYVTCNF
jgi:hypothetical protein